MASLNNTSIEPLMISSENIENGVNKHPTKIKCNWKKIITWCFTVIVFMMLLLTSILSVLVLVMYSKTETNLSQSHQDEENQDANQNNLKMFKQFNATLFNIEISQTKLGREIHNNSRKVNVAIQNIYKMFLEFNSSSIMERLVN